MQGLAVGTLYHAGGYGKTTMAQLLFNELSPSFLYSAYLELEWGATDARSLEHLQRTLLHGLGAEGVDQGMSSVLERQEHISNTAAGKKLLLVVDNVFSLAQLDALLPASWGEGSRLIITSRSKDIRDRKSSTMDKVGSPHKALRKKPLHTLLNPPCESSANAVAQQVAPVRMRIRIGLVLWKAAAVAGLSGPRSDAYVQPLWKTCESIIGSGIFLSPAPLCTLRWCDAAARHAGLAPNEAAGRPFCQGGVAISGPKTPGW